MPPDERTASSPMFSAHWTDHSQAIDGDPQPRNVHNCCPCTLFCTGAFSIAITLYSELFPLSLHHLVYSCMVLIVTMYWYFLPGQHSKQSFPTISLLVCANNKLQSNLSCTQRGSPSKGGLNFWHQYLWSINWQSVNLQNVFQQVVPFWGGRQLRNFGFKMELDCCRYRSETEGVLLVFPMPCIICWKGKNQCFGLIFSHQNQKAVDLADHKKIQRHGKKGPGQTDNVHIWERAQNGKVERWHKANRANKC